MKASVLAKEFNGSKFDDVYYCEPKADEDFINKKIAERNVAKKNKDYVTSDKIRDELLSMGIVLKDTREGTIFEVK